MPTLFTKKTGIEQAYREAERMIWARSNALRTGTFLVPEVRNVVDGTLLQEHLEGFQCLRDARRRLENPEELAARLGDILAIVHADPDNSFPSGGSPRHGDFSCENVLYRHRDGIVAVVDWADAKWYSDVIQAPSPYVDLVIFIASVFKAGTFGKRGLPPDSFAARFMASYQAASIRPIQHDLLKKEFATFTSLFLNYKWDTKTKLRLLLHRPYYWKASRFIEERYRP